MSQLFDHADFSARNIACGLNIECMKRRAGDGRTIIYIRINTASIGLPVYVGLAQARPNELRVQFSPMWGSLRLAPITQSEVRSFVALFAAVQESLRKEYSSAYLQADVYYDA